MARFGDFDQYLDNAGDPLAEGKLYFYESGTTTPKTTYADINNSIPNTNPVLLSAAGRQPNIFFDGVAKVILTDNNDVQIAVRDPAGETGTDFGDEWVATKIYNAVDVVLGSDGIYYRSLINGNQNNNPVTTTGSWTLLYSVEWNAGITYSTGDVVTYDSQQYQSLQNSNLNQNPASQTAYWVPLNFAWVATATYSEDQNVVGTDGILYTSLQNSNTGNDPATSPAYWVGTSAAAAASATAAANSATAAAASETAAAASETAAAASETAAAASETAAAASESAAATSETNAANSATAASTSETNAAASETAAAASASAASTSETNAAASASAASTSETNAAASETAAASSETAAADSESAAATSETNAANSASAASTSATNAASSATAAASSATAAAGSATAAASSATDAATAETGAETALAEFNSVYLGAYASQPTGTAAGQLYFNTTSNLLYLYNGSSWVEAGSSVNGTAERHEYVATSGQTNFSATYDVGFVDVYLNGSKLIPTTDFTATDGSTVVLGTGATTGDNVSIIAYGAFDVANTYTQSQADAKFAQVANNLSDLSSAATALTNLGLTATATELNYTDGVTSNIQTQIDNIDALPSQTGNSGKYLTTDGSTASWGTVAAGDGYWKLISTTSPSGASTVSIEDFSTNYKTFKIVFKLTSDTAFSLMKTELKVSGSYRTSSYKHIGHVLNYVNAGTYTEGSSGNANYIPMAEGYTVNSGQPLYGEIIFSDPNDLVRHAIMTDFFTVDGSANPYRYIGVGHYNGITGATMTGVRLSLNAGTMTGDILFFGLIA